MADQGHNETPDTGTDPAYVPDREVFDAYTHAEIWELAHERLAPVELRRLADSWHLAADTLETAFDDHAHEIARFSGEWSGLAANAAAGAAASLIRAGDDAVAICRVLQQLMADNSAAAESVRAAIPPPPEPYTPDPDPVTETVTAAARRTAYNTSAAALAADAQDAMTHRYNPTIPASGDHVPRFPIPHTAPSPDDPATPAGAGPRGASPASRRGRPAGDDEAPEPELPGTEPDGGSH